MVEKQSPPNALLRTPAREGAPSSRALTVVPSTSLRRTNSPNPAAVVPYRARLFAHASWATPGVASIGILLGSFAYLRHPSIGGPLVAVVWASLIPMFFRRRWNRLIERVSIWLMRTVRSRAEPSVRITGMVFANACFPTAAAGQPAVLARYQGGASADETHGIDFLVVADSGPQFIVHVSEQTFLDARPSHARRGELAECSIGPGDRVAVDGMVVSEVDAGADREGLRGTPLRLALVGSEDVPLVIRLISPGPRCR